MKSGTIFCIFAIIIGAVLIALMTYTLDYPHCTNCNAKVNIPFDKYCPYCGHKLDSVYVYDEIDRIKFERAKKNEK